MAFEPGGSVDRIVVGQIEQQREDADVHVGEIADALAQHRRRVAREAVAPLEHDDVERLLGAEVLPDQLLDAARELLVVEDGELDVEDRRFLRAGARLDARAHADAGARARASSAWWKRSISAGTPSSGTMRCRTSGTSQRSRCTWPTTMPGEAGIPLICRSTTALRTCWR